MPTVIFKTLSSRTRTGMSLWDAIRCLMLGEMLQFSAELAAVISLLVAAVIWFITWFTPNPGVNVSAALYTYERGFILERTSKATLSHLRNLLSNCAIWRFPPMLQKNNVKITDLHSWVLSKYLLEHVSDQGITNLRIGVGRFSSPEPVHSIVGFSKRRSQGECRVKFSRWTPQVCDLYRRPHA
jgi:hypothetical protein